MDRDKDGVGESFKEVIELEGRSPVGDTSCAVLWDIADVEAVISLTDSVIESGARTGAISTGCDVGGSVGDEIVGEREVEGIAV